MSTPEQRAEVDLSDVIAELRRIRDYSRDEDVIECLDSASRLVGEAASAAINAHFTRSKDLTT